MEPKSCSVASVTVHEADREEVLWRKGKGRRLLQFRKSGFLRARIKSQGGVESYGSDERIGVSLGYKA